jgi:excisionase family DNA binding protein
VTAVPAIDTHSAGAEFRVIETAAPVAYTVRIFGQKLSLSESFIWKQISDGRLRAIRVGRRTLVPHSELIRLLGTSVDGVRS